MDHANEWCQRKGVRFRVLNENYIHEHQEEKELNSVMTSENPRRIYLSQPKMCYLLKRKKRKKKLQK